MALEHANLTGTQLHEPKGVASAAAGTAYLADGAGSGVWVKVQKAQGACIRAESATATTGVTTSYKEINNTSLGGTIAWTQNNNEGLTANTTSGYIQVSETGMYNISYSASIVPATNGSVFEFTFGLDSGAGIVSQETYVKCIITTSGTVDSNLVSFTCLPPITANDKIYVMVRETSAGEEFTLGFSNLVVVRVA